MIGMVAGLVFIAYVYFGIYWWYTTVAWRSLRAESYTKNKRAPLALYPVHELHTLVLLAFLISQFALPGAIEKYWQCISSAVMPATCAVPGAYCILEDL